MIKIIFLYSMKAFNCVPLFKATVPPAVKKRPGTVIFYSFHSKYLHQYA